ncbi:MAG: RadC family protein [Armatimonadota bacterium]
MLYLPRYKVTLIKEGSCQVATRIISSPADVFAMLRGEIGLSDREIFLTLLLDTRNRVIGLHQVSIGSLNASIVHPRETFKAAILGNAAAIILAHSHPSGDLEPSREDLAVTSRLTQAGELLGVPVLDHLIISDDAFLSLKERGLL